MDRPLQCSPTACDCALGACAHLQELEALPVVAVEVVGRHGQPRLGVPLQQRARCRMRAEPLRACSGTPQTPGQQTASLGVPLQQRARRRGRAEPLRACSGTPQTPGQQTASLGVPLQQRARRRMRAEPLRAVQAPSLVNPPAAGRPATQLADHAGSSSAGGQRAHVLRAACRILLAGTVWSQPHCTPCCFTIEQHSVPCFWSCSCR